MLDEDGLSSITEYPDWLLFKLARETSDSEYLEEIKRRFEILRGKSLDQFLNKQNFLNVKTKLTWLFLSAKTANLSVDSHIQGNDGI